MAERRKRERGSAMVESSLVLLVFLALMIGIADLGQVLFLHQSLTERVRGALRYGVVNTFDAAAIQNMVLYGQPNEPDGGTPSFNLTRDMVSVSRRDADTAEDRVVVTVSNYPVLFLSPFIAGRAVGKPITGALPMETGNLP